MYVYFCVIQKDGPRQIFAGDLSPARQYMLHREAVRNDRTPESVKLGVGKERSDAVMAPEIVRSEWVRSANDEGPPAMPGTPPKAACWSPLSCLRAVFNFATVRARN